MTFTGGLALLYCSVRSEDWFFCCGGYWEHHHQGGDDLKSSSNCHQVTNVSQEGAVMILPTHENYVSIPTLPARPPCLHWMAPRHPILVSSWAVKLVIYLHKDRDADIIIHRPAENCGFLWGFFSFLFQRWRKWCEWGCPRLSRGWGSWKNASKVTSPHSGSSNTHFSLFNFHFETISKPMVCVYFFIKFKWSLWAW